MGCRHWRVHLATLILQTAGVSRGGIRALCGALGGGWGCISHDQSPHPECTAPCWAGGAQVGRLALSPVARYWMTQCMFYSAWNAPGSSEKFWVSSHPLFVISILFFFL